VVGALLLGVLPGSVAGVVTSGGWRSVTPTGPTVWQPQAIVAPSSDTQEATATPWETLGLRAATDARACARGTLIGEAVRGVVARVAPRVKAAMVARFDRKNVFSSPQVFLLEKEVVNSRGQRWFKALLPIRPNGTYGFVPAIDLSLRRTYYRLELSLSAFRLRLFEGCELVKKYRVGIGTGETPTPVGRFYINTLLKPRDPGTIYGTYAYGLSAYSNVLTYWKYGGFIGLHGTNQPSSIGKRSSHGCIRMLNRDIEELVGILPLGTPITIG
jgi:lipoprotein-anchoring transpeptidase ErfK/SrfK